MEDSESDEEEESVVRLPYTISMEEPEIIRETIKDEREHVFSLAKKIGNAISGLMIMVGVLSLIASTQYLFRFFEFPGIPDVRNFLTPEFLVVASGILGIVNIVCGFVLIARK